MVIKGEILTTNKHGEYTEVVCLATATCVMMDKMGGPVSMPKELNDGNHLSAEHCLENSLKLQAATISLNQQRLLHVA